METKIKMSFDPEIAKDIGVEAAILLENIKFLIKQNNNNWICKSIKDFSELFPFWTQKKIYNLLKKLENKKYIKTGNFNKNKYDRTKWYQLINN